MELFNFSRIIRSFIPLGEPNMSAEENENVESKAPTRADFLRKEIRQFRDRRDRRIRYMLGYFILGIIMTIGSAIYYYHTKNSQAGIFFACYGALFLVSPILRSSKEWDLDIITLENELDLLETSQVSTEQRAEKLFKHHQYELKKYYDQTLRHSKWIFVVGLICMFIGILIIGATLYFISYSISTKLEDKIIIAALGAIGSTLVNFIAVIYLRMFTEILRAVKDFHNRLVSTHNLYFANFISTKVSDSCARDLIFSEIAKNLTKN